MPRAAEKGDEPRRGAMYKLQKLVLVLVLTVQLYELVRYYQVFTGST